MLRKFLEVALGLFVDDGRFALAIVVWLALFAALQQRLSVPRDWQGPLLVLGLLAILLQSALHRAKRA